MLGLTGRTGAIFLGTKGTVGNLTGLVLERK